MKLTIEHHDMTVTVDDPTVNHIDEAVQLCKYALLALGYSPDNVAEALGEVGE